jgi:transcriptional regulator with XRE-family HTH domain
MAEAQPRRPRGRAAPASILADRLNHLFDTVHPRDREPYSNQEVADTINGQHGENVIHRTYIHQLRTGERTNPTLRHLYALADFFGVPASYFLDASVAEEVERDLELVAALRQAGVREVALRIADLDYETRSAVLRVIGIVEELDEKRGRGS